MIHDLSHTVQGGYAQASQFVTYRGKKGVEGTVRVSSLNRLSNFFNYWFRYKFKIPQIKCCLTIYMSNTAEACCFFLDQQIEWQHIFSSDFNAAVGHVFIATVFYVFESFVIAFHCSHLSCDQLTVGYYRQNGSVRPEDHFREYSKFFPKQAFASPQSFGCFELRPQIFQLNGELNAITVFSILIGLRWIFLLLVNGNYCGSVSVYVEPLCSTPRYSYNRQVQLISI